VSGTAELPVVLSAVNESKAPCLSRRRRFKCAECNRRYMSWSRLEMHMVSHDGMIYMRYLLIY